MTDALEPERPTWDAREQRVTARHYYEEPQA